MSTAYNKRRSAVCLYPTSTDFQWRNFLAIAFNYVLSLITFPGEDEQEKYVATPVWFARAGDFLLLRVKMNSIAVNHILHYNVVNIAECLLDGEPIGGRTAAKAHILDGEESARASAILNRKYWPANAFMNLIHRNLARQSFVYVQIAYYWDGWDA